MATPEPFEFVVEKTWVLSGPSYIVTGVLVSGNIQVGDRFEIVGTDATPGFGTVRGLEFHVDRHDDDPRRHGLQVDAESISGMASGVVLRGPR